MTIHGRLRNFAAGTSLAMLVACGGSGGDAPSAPNPSPGLSSTPAAMLSLQQEASCDEFKDYISQSIIDLVLNVGVVACPGCVVATTAGGPLEAAAGTDATSFDAFTGTNNQEAGVDELDQIEADANGNFYLIDGNHLVVANGLPPADLREITNLELTTEGSVEGLILDPDNQRLVAIVADFDFFGPQLLSFAPQSNPRTEILFIDVADPANPVIDNTLSVDGFRLAVRRIGDRIHLVSHTTPTIPLPVFDNIGLHELRESSGYRNRGRGHGPAERTRARHRKPR